MICVMSRREGGNQWDEDALTFSISRGLVVDCVPRMQKATLEGLHEASRSSGGDLGNARVVTNQSDTIGP